MMARSIRIEYPGAFYHVMARGNRRQAIFRGDADRRWFLDALGEACGKTGWRMHAWVLMGNHYHLFVQTPEPNLVPGMKWLQNAYTRRFNTKYRLWGRMFGDRYKSVLVEGEQPMYYETLMDYIHLNPARARMVDIAGGESLLYYPWSSVAGAYALRAEKRPTWAAASVGLATMGCTDSVAGRRKFVERLDRRALEEGKRAGLAKVDQEADRRRSHLRKGWYWGTQAFAEKLIELSRPLVHRCRSATYRSGPVAKAHDEAEAERIVRRGLEALGLAEAELPHLRGSDPRKAALAAALRERTTVSQAWIAGRLAMKSPANVSQAVRRFRVEKQERGSSAKEQSDALSTIFD